MLTLQRAFDAAHAAVVALPDDADPGERGRLREAERAAVLALHRARAGTPFEAWEQQRRVQDAVRQQ